MQKSKKSYTIALIACNQQMIVDNAIILDFKNLTG